MVSDKNDRRKCKWCCILKEKGELEKVKVPRKSWYKCLGCESLTGSPVFLCLDGDNNCWDNWHHKHEWWTSSQRLASQTCVPAHPWHFHFFKMNTVTGFNIINFFKCVYHADVSRNNDNTRISRRNWTKTRMSKTKTLSISVLLVGFGFRHS